ncbi:MAG: DUF952 domain-containing protein [Maricaulaceae bacterium]
MSAEIYRIAPRAAWAEAKAIGRYSGAPHDRADGFIHFSYADQVLATAQKHYADQRDLVIVAVRAADLGDALKAEPSRGGALFPHLYAALPTAAATRVAALPDAPEDRAQALTAFLAQAAPAKP